MAITARNPRRARLVVTLAGLALTVLGIVLWGTGDMDKVSAESEMQNNSASSWGDVFGYETDQDAEYAQAVSDRDSAETQMTFGIVVVVLGLALVGSRWLIKPATASAGQGVRLTKEQEEQAIALYLEAQKRHEK